MFFCSTVTDYSHLVSFDKVHMHVLLLSRSDAETGGGERMGQPALRQRRRRSVQQVGPSASDVAMQRESEGGGPEEREQHRRAYGGGLDNILSYLLFP